MPKADLKKLAEELEGMYKYYHGWHFFFENPELISYQQMGGNIVILCTPDYEEKGVVPIEVHDIGQNVIESAEVSYEGEIDAPELFRIVKPYLDKYSDR